MAFSRKKTKPQKICYPKKKNTILTEIFFQIIKNFFDNNMYIFHMNQFCWSCLLISPPPIMDPPYFSYIIEKKIWKSTIKMLQKNWWKKISLEKYVLSKSLKNKNISIRKKNKNRPKAPFKRVFVGNLRQSLIISIFAPHTIFQDVQKIYSIHNIKNTIPVVFYQTLPQIYLAKISTTKQVNIQFKKTRKNDKKACNFPKLYPIQPPKCRWKINAFFLLPFLSIFHAQYYILYY